MYLQSVIRLRLIQADDFIALGEVWTHWRVRPPIEALQAVVQLWENDQRGRGIPEAEIEQP